MVIFAGVQKKLKIYYMQNIVVKKNYIIILYAKKWGKISYFS